MLSRERADEDVVSSRNPVASFKTPEMTERRPPAHACVLHARFCHVQKPER